MRHDLKTTEAYETTNDWETMMANTRTRSSAKARPAPGARVARAAAARAKVAETLASSATAEIPETAASRTAAPERLPAPRAAPASRPDAAVAPVATLMTAGAEQARQAYARTQATTESLRQAVAESASATSRGALEVNGKVLDALRAQGDAAFDLWRSTLTAPSLSEAIRAQASGTRRIYETSAGQWREVAEAAGRWFGASLGPMQAVWQNRAR